MKYTWNEDTLETFKFLTDHYPREKVLYEITEFVENNTQLEENEVEQDLIDDLVAQVYTER
tara:strand:+ start:1257 stop:1439 length:183 start_codon:yes stop_codon:yes gene_type:complete